MDIYNKVKCKSCKENFGSEEREWLCSICFKNKDQIEKLKKEEEESAKNLEKQRKDEERKGRAVQENTSNCWSCNKKVGILGFKCECEYIYCKSHRHFSDHNCDYDYKLKKIIIKK